MCRKKSPCEINSCQRNHHRLLHNHQQRLSTEAPVFQPPNPQSHTAVANGFCTNGSTVSRNITRLRILPVSLKNNSVVVNTFALLDPGATLTLISEAVANKLQMDGKLAPLSIQWANGDVANEDESKAGSVHISGIFLNGRTYALNDVRTVKHLPLQRQSVDRERLIEKWPYLKEINFESYDNVQPTILIGENNGLLTATRQLIHNKSNNPIASRTWLGWTISGNDGSDKASEVNLVYMMQETHDDDLHALVKSSFQLDDSLTIGCDRKRSREDERALNIMKTTTTKLEDYRWQTGLLWKRDDTRLPDSKFAARQRLYLLEKKLDKDPVLRKAYGDIIDDYLQKKYLVNAEDKDLIGSKTWYLPHFPVINPMKPHKIRIVFDAAARSNGIALNDELIQGPDLLQSLPGVLFKFRQGQFGFTADIKEMFHRVRIRDEDNNSQLILWRGENRTDNPRILKMTAMMFGATCSPSSAIYVKDLNADEYLDTYPEAVYAIKNNHYMDDYWGHADDEAAATALIEDIKSQHDRKFKKSEAKRLKQFVANRLSEISDLTNITDWNWLPTNFNVTDDATRMTPKEFEADSRWYTGPSFLYEDVSIWPKMKTNKMTRSNEEDETNEFVGTISVPARFVLPDVMRFSNWSRLIRATAWIMRYKENLKIKGRITRGDEDAVYYQGELTTTEIEWANKLWIRQSQQNSFHKEIVELRKNKVVSRSSKLYNIIPQLDDEGIIRLRGRMSNIEGDQWLKTPVVLDGRDKYTELLIKYYHDQANHIGHEGVMNEIKQRYWILKLKPKLRQRRKLCNTCKIRCAKPENTIMGQLPAVRLLSNNPAFTFTGVDYFGPINVKVGRHLEKRYGVLFTCLTVRAIHIEVASSLTTDSCIMALRRFIARRGCPNELFSDNGTNLKGADTELKRCLKELDQSAIRGALTKHRIKWRFIPPAAPHMGGCWERLVRSVKTSLYAILKEVNTSDETLNTLLAEIEQIINSRPLVEVPYHPDEPEALTPNHFLIGRSSASAPISDFDDKDLILRKRWRMRQRLADHFWNRWRKEFLPNLNQQNKWKTQSGRDVQVGDVVLLFNDNEVRGNWPKGIIDKVFPGPDGKIRVVEVRTSSGTFKRSIVKVCVLDLEDGKSDEVPIPEGRMLSKSQT
ncbi:uncharacterized protein LOC129942380 [Eupeodes corollae]|uniref:uncharacterized protein LOC129942380 n=1 Tax=Eupeodes corollae TaxID=290404 RepID=UPI0024928895|nr:uncharacterized protein LOC129942380 [Eupeodes corollae]